MAAEEDFDFSAEITFDGTQEARDNWDCLKRHMVAEWSGDLDATMATMTRNDPFQIFYGTGLHVHGWENVREFYRERFTTFSGQGFYARRLVCTAHYITAQGWHHVTPQPGLLFGAMSSGKPVFLPMALWVHFEDGLIKGEAAYFDGAELQRQLRAGATGDIHAPIW